MSAKFTKLTFSWPELDPAQPQLVFLFGALLSFGPWNVPSWFLTFHAVINTTEWGCDEASCSSIIQWKERGEVHEKLTFAHRECLKRVFIVCSRDTWTAPNLLRQISCLNICYNDILGIDMKLSASYEPGSLPKASNISPSNWYLWMISQWTLLLVVYTGLPLQILVWGGTGGDKGTNL